MSIYSSVNNKLILPYDVQCRIVPFEMMTHLRECRLYRASRPSTARPASAASHRAGRLSEPSSTKAAPQPNFAERFDEALRSTLTRMETLNREMRQRMTKEYYHKRNKWIYTIRTLKVRPTAEEAANARREREKLRKANVFVSSKELKGIVSKLRKKRFFSAPVKKGPIEHRMQMDKLKKDIMHEAQQKRIDAHLQVKMPNHVRKLLILSFLPGLIGAGGIFFCDYLTIAYKRFVRSIQYWLGINAAFMGGTIVGLEVMRYHPAEYLQRRNGLLKGTPRNLVGFAAVLPSLYMMAIADSESWTGIVCYTAGSIFMCLYTIMQAQRKLCPTWFGLVHVPLFINNGIVGMIVAYSLISKHIYVAEMEQLHEKLSTGLYRPEEDQELQTKED